MYCSLCVCVCARSRVCVRTSDMSSGRGGPGARGEAGGAVTAGADDVVSGSEEVDAAARVGAPAPQGHGLVLSVDGAPR